MSDFATTYGDTTLVLTNDQDIELGTAQLGDQFGTIKRAVIRRTGDRELITNVKTKKLLMVLIHNPGFEMQLECAFAKSVTPPGMGESLSLPLVGVTGFIMEGVTVQWEAGSERGLSIPVSSWDVMQGATAYRLTAAGEQVMLGAAEISAPAAAPTLSGSVTSSSTLTSWSAVARAAGYQLQSSTDAVTWTDLITTTAQSYIHTGLTPGSTTFYRVRATNAAGSGPWSDELELETADAAPATAPTLSGVALTTDYSTTLSWTTSVANTEDYELQVSTDAGSTWSTLSEQTGSTYSHAVGTAATPLRYRVRARNTVGNGPWSTAISLQTTQIGAPVLNGGQSISGAWLTWGSLTLADDYELQFSDDEGATWAALLVTANNEHTDSTSWAEDTRWYRLRARNVIETGPFSTIVSVTREPLAIPDIVLVAASRDWLVSGGFPPVPFATSYLIEWSLLSDFSAPVSSTISGRYAVFISPTNVGALFDGAIPGFPFGESIVNQMVYARAKAFGVGVSGDWGATASIMTAPESPTDPAWTGYTAGWTAGAGADRYNIYMDTELIETTAATSIDLTARSAEIDAGRQFFICSLRDSDGLESPTVQMPAV